MIKMSDWQSRAENVLAQGCLTYSKSAQCYAPGFPTHLISGKGCHVKAADGKRYIDFCGGLGSNLLDCSNNFSLPTIYEVELAEKIRERIPCMEKLRLLKTGSEGTSAAVRIARAYKENQSKKRKIRGVGCSYNGWHNWRIAEEKPGTGTWKEGFRKVRDIDKLIFQIELKRGYYGYCILEPLALDYSEEHRKKVERLQELCIQYDIVLIFDEVVSGFRTLDYCAANMWNIQPDIMVMGKAMASGWPMAVVGGKAEIMDTPGYFVSSTFAGELSSIKRALKVIKFLTPERINELWYRGKYFHDNFNAISKQIQLKGIPTKAVFVGDELFKNLFWQEMCKRGYLFFKAQHITFAHSMRVIKKTLKVCREVISEIEAGNVKLEGELCKEVFKRHEVVKNES
jgi:glutamate-1-semialdehyde 2,1-aminomutase